MTRAPTNLVSILVALTAFAACGHRDGAPGRLAAPPKRGGEAAKAPICSEAPQRFVAVVAARSTANVTAQTEGVLTEVDVRLGDSVKAGDVIARIDEQPLRSVVAAAAGVAAGRVAEARAAVVRSEHASTEFARQQRLQQEGLATVQAADTARSTHAESRATIAQTQAAVREATAHLAQAQWSLDHAVVRAPVAGVVASRFVDPGNEIAHGEPLVRIVSDQTPWIRFGMPANEVQSVRVGDEVVFVSVEGNHSTHARVLRVSPDVDPLSELVVAEAELTDAPVAALSPGIGGYVQRAPRPGEQPCGGAS